jgi:hypothetical protein
MFCVRPSFEQLHRCPFGNSFTLPYVTLIPMPKAENLTASLAKFFSQIRPKPPVIPLETQQTLFSFIHEFSSKTGLEAPRLVFEPLFDHPARIAFYNRVRKSIYPNCRKLAKTWGKGEFSIIFWKGIIGHEFGHHVQYIEGRRFSWKRRLVEALRHPYGTGSPVRERDAWETGQRLTGISRKEAFSAYSKIRPSLWNAIAKFRRSRS